MKSFLTAGLLIWVALVAEVTFPGQIPGGSLIFPVTCGICLWFRSAFGMILCGTGLLVDAVVRPAPFPWVGVLLPLLAAMLCRSGGNSSIYRSTRRWRLIPTAMELPLLVMISVCLDRAVRIPGDEWSISSESGLNLLRSLIPSLIIAMPLSACFSLFMRIADEFGMRRRHSHVSSR